jgi:hypothetical protein
MCRCAPAAARFSLRTQARLNPALFRPCACVRAPPPPLSAVRQRGPGAGCAGRRCAFQDARSGGYRSALPAGHPHPAGGGHYVQRAPVGRFKNWRRCWGLYAPRALVPDSCPLPRMRPLPARSTAVCWWTGSPRRVQCSTWTAQRCTWRCVGGQCMGAVAGCMCVCMRARHLRGVTARPHFRCPTPPRAHRLRTLIASCKK